DVGDVAVLLVGGGAEQRLPELAEDPRRILEIEENRRGWAPAIRPAFRWAGHSPRVAIPPKLEPAFGTHPSPSTRTDDPSTQSNSTRRPIWTRQRSVRESGVET